MVAFQDVVEVFHLPVFHCWRADSWFAPGLMEGRKLEKGIPYMPVKYTPVEHFENYNSPSFHLFGRVGS